MLPENGLNVPWHEYVTGFVNPPFGKVDEPRFIQKAVEEAALGWEGILLLPSKTGAPWFEPLYEHSPCICFWGNTELDVEGRIWFHEEEGGATFNTEFVYLGPNYEKFAKVFSRVGQLVYPRHDQALTTRITGRTMPSVSYAGSAHSDDLFRNAERELRVDRFNRLAVGTSRMPPEITCGDVLERDDVPELRAIIADLPVRDLGQALLLLANEPDAVPPTTTRGKKKARVGRSAADQNSNQVGLPIHTDGRGYHNEIERRRFDERVCEIIHVSPKPLSRADIVAMIPCTEHEYRTCIKRLKTAERIEQVDTGKSARYRRRPPPRTEQDDRADPTTNGDPTGSPTQPN